MAEASLSFEHEADQARADAGSAGASPAVVNLFRDGRDQAEPSLDDEIRGDLRVLIVLCAASAAMTLYALYAIASGLKVI